MKAFKTFRGRLFFWYATSLVTITVFFYLAIHLFRLPYGNIQFFLLLLVLALEGFFIIRKMTNELARLSSKIKSITSKNLSEKITNIDGEDEIGELASSFNQLLDRLDEAFKRERQFIGDVAHELKTPLSVQRASLELTLTKDRPKEEYQKAIEEALIDSNRISGTLKNILDLAWSQTDDAQRGENKVNLSVVVNEIKEVATKLAFDKHITVGGSVDNEITVSGRKDKLFRAFLNVVDNAIKFSPKNGTVTIDLLKRDDLILFRVKDNGPGISEQDLPHIFERFYRGSKADKTFGSGLGLAIVQAVIKAHQGTIDIKSKVGHGTTVVITFPIITLS